jgi:nucleoside-diphosphate-sugar epimerase
LIAITGASGYIGAYCVAEAMRRGKKVIAISAQPANHSVRSHGDRLKWQYVGHRYPFEVSEWARLLEGAEAVVHCAARVHKRGEEDLARMRRDNAELTKIVSDAACDIGVRRFVYLSSAAVYGDEMDRPALNTNAQLNGASAYAVSKIEAEHFLMDRPVYSGVNVHILRPPAVYGRKAPGNLSRLARMVAQGWPLPFGAIHNRRSIVSIRGLVSAIFWCLERELGNEVSIWNPTDLAPISTTQIVNAIARGRKRAATNFAMSPSVLRAAMIAVGQRRMASQLLDSWELDSSALIGAGFDGAIDSEPELESMGRSFVSSPKDRA